MKTWKLRTFNPVNWLLLVALLLGATFLCKPQTTARAQPVGPLPSHIPFVVRNYGGKCLDFGPPPQVSGAPVFIYDCSGTPTYLAEFHHNVSVGLRSFVIKNEGAPDRLIISDNKFVSPNPTNHLGVGDFDGDGAQDLFLATGAAWYYAPAGKAEWRYLNAQTDKLNTLLFGDFDADGRTDVFTQHGGNKWDV